MTRPLFLFKEFPVGIFSNIMERFFRRPSSGCRGPACKKKRLLLPRPSPGAAPSDAFAPGADATAVDVELRCYGDGGQKSEKLNWRTSIVDR
jgi:hypothetical protein